MNRPKHAANLYLPQHQDNPVGWREWSEEAFAEARAGNRPVLLWVGYAAHCCHVMAHESFEHPAIAAVMDELFMNIKVDREERPDIDHACMSACVRSATLAGAAARRNSRTRARSNCCGAMARAAATTSLATAQVVRWCRWHLKLAAGAFRFVAESMTGGDGLAYSYRAGRLITPGLRARPCGHDGSGPRPARRHLRPALFRSSATLEHTS